MTSEVRFRALLAESGAERLELARAWGADQWAACCYVVATSREQKDHLRFLAFERQVLLQKRLCLGLAGRGV
jgi:hypothetical protein